jgi:hypothetical protein
MFKAPSTINCTPGDGITVFEMLLLWRESCLCRESQCVDICLRPERVRQRAEVRVLTCLEGTSKLLWQGTEGGKGAVYESDPGGFEELSEMRMTSRRPSKRSDSGARRQEQQLQKAPICARITTAFRSRQRQSIKWQFDGRLQARHKSILSLRVQCSIRLSLHR